MEVHSDAVELQVFSYPPGAGEACEEHAREMERVSSRITKLDIVARVKIGQRMNAVMKLLRGQFQEWLAWRFPDWSDESARQWRAMGAAVTKAPGFLDTLIRFESTTAASDFCTLSPEWQQQIVADGAFTLSRYRAAVFGLAMRERMADEGLSLEHRAGDVLHAIEEAQSDRALKPVADLIYQEHRQLFSRLADREPTEMDAEVGHAPDPAEPPDRPFPQLAEGENGLWLCQWDGERFVPVAPVLRRVEVWPGAHVIAAFPRISDGPVPASWQERLVGALSGLGVHTVGTLYGGVEMY